MNLGSLSQGCPAKGGWGTDATLTGGVARNASPATAGIERRQELDASQCNDRQDQAKDGANRTRLRRNIGAAPRKNGSCSMAFYENISPHPSQNPLAGTFSAAGRLG